MQGKSEAAIERANEATVNVAKVMERILAVWKQQNPEVAQSSSALAERLRQATNSKRNR
jgi:hypothetical protein